MAVRLCSKRNREGCPKSETSRYPRPAAQRERAEKEPKTNVGEKEIQACRGSARPLMGGERWWWRGVWKDVVAFSQMVFTAAVLLLALLLALLRVKCRQDLASSERESAVLSTLSEIGAAARPRRVKRRKSDLRRARGANFRTKRAGMQMQICWQSDGSGRNLAFLLVRLAWMLGKSGSRSQRLEMRPQPSDELTPLSQSLGRLRPPECAAASVFQGSSSSRQSSSLHSGAVLGPSSSGAAKV